MLIIGLVYVPYMARPVPRPGALFVKSSWRPRALEGAGPIRIMFTEVVPNLASTIVVFFTLLIANAILLEVRLSVPRRGRAGAGRRGAP